CVPNRGFAEMDGTSMATPHVAGLAALLASAKPAASAADLEAAILASCTRPGTMPQARANRGVPDATAALAHLTGRAEAALVAGRPAAARDRAEEWRVSRRGPPSDPVGGWARARRSRACAAALNLAWGRAPRARSLFYARGPVRRLLHGG